MTTKYDVIRVHRTHPKWSATKIAVHLGCLPSYVRATGKRNNMKLPKGRPPNPNSLWSLGALAIRLGLNANNLRAIAKR